MDGGLCSSPYCTCAELLEETDQDVCTDPDCKYMEPHKHGFACDSNCHCLTESKIKS